MVGSVCARDPRLAHDDGHGFEAREARDFKGWLDEHWDHGFILNDADENGIAAAQLVQPTKYYLLPYNPTAENIAAYFYRELARTLNDDRIRVSSVTLWETDRACVRYAEESAA